MNSRLAIRNGFSMMGMGVRQRMFCSSSFWATDKPEKKLKGRVGADYEGFRVAKYLSHSGVCSRKEAEKYILEGQVVVGEEVVTRDNMRTLKPNDLVFLNGDLVKPKKGRSKIGKVYLYYKRPGEAVSTKEEYGSKGGKIRSSLVQLQKKFPSLPRLVAVGRLDVNSEGLLVLSDSPLVARALELPTSHFKRSYKVRAHGLVFEDRLQKLRNGILTGGIKYKPMKVEITRPSTNSWFDVELTEGKNREIRKTFAAIGLTVNRIIRTKFGPYKLDGLLPGQVQEVSVHNKIRELLKPGGISDKSKSTETKPSE